MAQKKFTDTFEEKIVKVFKREESEKGDIQQIQVAYWVKNGKPGKSRFERRIRYMTEDGEKVGKVIGFSLDDMHLIEIKFEEICYALSGKSIPPKNGAIPPAGVESADVF